MKKHLQPLTPAALYARVSSDRQDVDLSVSAQLRALKDYAKSNGYSVAREYVDEAESGRVADRPQFREMIEEGSQPKAPFEIILVWKFSRFTRKREHAVAFKSMLRRKGVRVVSITEHADDSPTGKLMEAIIESVDEFYSENLAQDVVRGMREAASRGFFLASKAPFGYKRVKVSDGVKERPTLEVDPATAPVVKEIFESSLSGNGLKEICKALNGRGITNRGKRWNKGGLHYLLTNEAYTGTAVWGRISKGEKPQDPVRVEGAWRALVSRELFDAVQEAMRNRAPKVRRPARVGSRFLLSRLLNPNPPKDTDGRREDRGGGGVRELQGGWPGLHWGSWEVSGRSSAATQGPYGRLRELGCAGWRENTQQGTLADRDDASLRGRWVSCRLAVRLGVEWLAAGPRRD